MFSEENKRKIPQGFTVIEILLVVGIIAVLAAIVIFALNPSKQIADTYNGQRRSDARTISTAVSLYYIDQSQLPAIIPNVSTEICREGAASCSGFVDLSALTLNQKYLIAIPTDPKANNPNGSGYFIIKDSTTGRIFVNAPLAENGAIISTDPAALPPPSDTTPPTVSITAPTTGSSVNNTIAISANASDNIAVLGVQFKLDGSNFGAEDTTSPYSIPWNTTTTTNGSHTLTAVARDAAGNTTTSASITVTVNNQATSLTINMAAAALTNANRSLTGITLQNNGTSAIVVDKITVSWTNAARRIRQIQIGGVQVWSGTQTSGTLLDISNRTLNVGAAATPINRFLFNASMLGNTITITFTMLDGTTKTVSRSF